MFRQPETWEVRQPENLENYETLCASRVADRQHNLFFVGTIV